MPDQYALGDFLEAFKDAYQTIEVRVALVKRGAGWQGVFAAFRVHAAPAGIVNAWFQELVDRYGKMSASTFRVAQYCYGFTQLGELLADFPKGKLVAEDWELSFEERGEFASLQGNLPYFHGSEAKPTLLNWPTLQGSLALLDGDKILQLLGGDPEINRAAELAGYPNPYAAVSQLLEVEFESSRRPLLQIDLAVPIRFESFSAKKTAEGTRLKVTALAHRSLPIPQCAIRPMRRGVRHQPLEHKLFALQQEKDEGGLRRWIGEQGVFINKDDHVEVELVHGDLGRLQLESVNPIRLLKTEDRNPLYRALAFFCPPDEITAILEDPGNAPKSGSVKQISLKNNAKLYEVTVQWVVSCLGLRAVWLHGYETKRSGKFEYGSIDCLGYDESKNVLLLINCTAGPPNTNELNRQMALQSRLVEEAFKDCAVKVYSVVFTASDRHSTKQVPAVEGEVRVFYRQDINNLMNLIKNGREARFIEAIISSPFGQLQEP
jgi:hypothetical protein